MSDTATVINVALVIATGVYAYLTLHILRVNREVLNVMRTQLEAATRPYVVVDVFTFTGSPLFKLRIRNLGHTPARNLQLSLDKDFFRFGFADDQHDLRKLHFFNKWTNSFAPGSELTFDLGVSHDIYKDSRLTPWEFVVSARYEYGNTVVEESTQIDLNMFRGSAANPDPLVAELREIRKAIEKMTQ